MSRLPNTMPRTSITGTRYVPPSTTTCLSFNGSNQNSSWTAGLYNYTSKITLGGYFMFMDNTNYSNFPVFWSVGGNGGSFLIMNSSGIPGFHVKISTEKSANGTFAPKFGVWYAIWGTYDSTVGSNNLNYYLFDRSGNLLDTGTTTTSSTITYTNTTPCVAFDPARSSFFMKIKTSRIFVANTAMTQAGIQTFIKTGILSAADSAAVGNYSLLSDGSGSTVRPLIGSGNGTLSNSPTWDTNPPAKPRSGITAPRTVAS